MTINVDSLQIRRFKNVVDATIDLDNITVLVGSNNSGKSSVLQAVQFATSVAQSADIAGLTTRGDQVVGSLSAAQLVYSPLRDVGALATGGRLLEEVGTAIQVVMSATIDTMSETSSVIVRRGRNRNINVEINGVPLGARLRDIEQPFSVYVPGLAGISSFEGAQTSGVVRKAAARGDANSVFRNVLLLLSKDPVAWEQFIADLRRVYPNADLDISFDPEVDDYITVTGNRRLPIDASGTGFLQTVQILSYINIYKPSLLLLDEPDSHLHPDNQRRLARLLVDLAERRTFQVILATHSRHMLDELMSDAKFYWLQAGAVQPDASFDLVELLLDLGALDRGDRLRNGATPFVVITEDTEEEPLTALLDSSGFEPTDYDIWSYHGSSNLNVAKALAAFIKSVAPGTHVIVHRDRDFLTDADKASYEADLRTANLLPFVTLGSDVESYYLNAEHVHELYNAISVQRAEELISLATAETRDKSVAKRINYWDTEERRRRNNAVHNTLSPGEIAERANADYDASPEQFRHGKSALKRLRALLHAEPGGGTALFRTSAALDNAELRGLGHARGAGDQPAAAPEVEP